MPRNRDAAPADPRPESPAGPGRLEWIGVRPASGVPMREHASVQARSGRGLDGDRYARKGRREVTLLQAEHLPRVAQRLGRAVAPAELRRNLMVSGIDVVALAARRFRIGSVRLEGTGPCDPCVKLAHALGDGGMHAMQGHGGITARVLEEGTLRVGDPVAIEGCESA
jgi:MOSC domain-containing protein YiiM